MIRIASVTSSSTCDGETCGRVILSDSLRVSGRQAEGTRDGSAILTAAAAWNNTELSMGALWLRELIHAQAAAMGIDPCNVGTLPAVDHMQFRAWTLQHAYIAGLPPYVSGGVEICCRMCLTTLTAALANTAAFLLATSCGGDWGYAYTAVRGGGELPLVPAADRA